MAIIRQNSFDGTDETAFTTAGSASFGDEFQTEWTPDADLFYDTDFAAVGPASLRIDPLNSGSNGWLRWEGLSVSAGSLYARLYLRLAAAPANPLVFFQFGDISAQWTVTAGQTVGGETLGAVTIPTGQWVRIEMRATIGGDCEHRLYLDPDSTTPDETVTGGGASGTLTTISVGTVFQDPVSTQWWLDDVVVEDSDWVGPADTGPTTIRAELGGGTDEATVTTTTTTFDTVWTAGGSALHDTDKLLNGVGTIRLGRTNGENAWMRWEGLAAELGKDAYVRMYLRMDRWPPGNIILAQLHTAAPSQVCRVEIGRLGTLKAYAASATTGESTVPIATGQWIRIDLHVHSDAAAGVVEARLFNRLDTDPDTPSEVITASSQNTDGGDIDRVSLGFVFMDAGYPQAWMGGMVVTDTDYADAIGELDPQLAWAIG